MKKINLVFIFLVLLSLLACGQNKPVAQNTPVAEKTIEQPALKIVDKFVVRDFSFELIEETGDCLLAYKKGEATGKLKLNISTPCQVWKSHGIEAFVDNKTNKRFNKGDVIWRNYDKFPLTKAYIFVVLGGITKTESCRFETASDYRVVLVRTDEVKLGKSNPGQTCSDIDEPDIQFAAREEKP